MFMYSGNEMRNIYSLVSSFRSISLSKCRRLFSTSPKKKKHESEIENPCCDEICRFVTKWQSPIDDQIKCLNILKSSCHVLNRRESM